MSKVLETFIELTRIPRPSGHHDLIAGYLEDFAERHGLEHRRDEADNVLIVRPGTEGRTVVLQAHQDMVPNSVGPFDFRNTPLEIYEKDGWMHAKGTTLGADDGSGMAVILCALTDPELEGIGIQGLFTSDEEIGLIGASKLGKDWLEGKYLINIDSEDFGEICIGSGGSCDATVSYGVECSPSSGNHYLLEISGLKGGHSAIDVDCGRANAILLAVRFLRSLEGVRIASIDGGSAPNAIPLSCKVLFSVPGGCDISAFVADVKEEYGAVEDTMEISLRPMDAPSEEWTEGFTSMVLGKLSEFPNGVLGRDGYGISASSNIGVVHTGDGHVEVVVKPRTSDGETMDRILEKIEGIAQGGSYERPSVFPAWREDAGEHLVVRSVECFKGLFGYEPKVTVTHAGLETSIFKDLYPDMEAISIGPTIYGAHSPDERMDLSTLDKIQVFLYGLIKSLF
ncbi:MAG: beta-Ala-His dipeptidase [archaeon]|nr:beta-Ala-His dipeptidase [archaeon]